MSTNQLLGLDVGKVRIGVARASWAAALAEPLQTIRTDNATAELKKLIREYHVDTLVIGLPRNLQGNDTAQTIWVRDWVSRTKKQLDVTFFWQDEALTSRLAELSTGARKKNRYSTDALSATIVLQDFLGSEVTERVNC